MKKLAVLCLFMVYSCVVNPQKEEIPQGWSKGGGLNYEMGVDTTTYYTEPRSFYVKSLSSATEKTFGQLQQTIDGAKYLGKRIQLSTYMKVSKKVTGRYGGAAIWIHTYSKDKTDMTMGAYDCYSWETGTDGKWKKCFVVLDVPPDTDTISYAFKVFGLGQVWMDDITLKIVDPKIPIRGLYQKFRSIQKFRSTPFNIP